MLRRYTASADNTIVSAYQLNLETRGTGANAGRADILETFSIYGRQSTSSQELSRILVKFPVAKISTDRTAAKVPASGSVNFYLKLYNAPSSKTVPRDYKLLVKAISRDWQEGDGLDLEGYKDLTYSKYGSNWIVANDSIAAATATFGGLAALASDNGTELILINYDGTSVTFTTDSSLSPSAGTATKIGTSGISSAAQATQALHVAFAAAIAAASLSMTLTPASWTSETSITLTHDQPGPAGNTTIVVPANVTAQGAGSGVNGDFTGGTGRWQSVGGDYRNKPDRTQNFVVGPENLEVNVTKFVEDWIKNITGSKFIPNYGFGIRMSASYEASSSAAAVRIDSNVILNPDGAIKSYYTKRFFGRGSQYFFFRPAIEARWDSTKTDDRGHFFFSSSRAPASENLNTLYFYNIVRGKLVNLPGVGTAGKLVVSLFSGSKDNTVPSGSGVTRTPLTLCGSTIYATASYVSTGIYSCNLCLPSSSVKTVYDVWFSGSDSIGNPNKAKQYFTGSLQPLVVGGGESTAVPLYYLAMTNLQPKYLKNDTPRLNLFVRKKNWRPTIYTVATTKIESETIISASYKVYRILDGFPAVPFGTGSDYHTGLSYDISGNYFDLDMKLLEPGYAYGLKFAFYDERNTAWNEQEETFKFRVEDYEY